MIRTTLISAALTLGAMAVKAEVINRRIRCQYNGGKWTEVHYTNQSDGDFTLIWDDSPRMSYVWDKPGHGTYSFMVTDKLGGRWIMPETTANLEKVILASSLHTLTTIM